MQLAASEPARRHVRGGQRTSGRERGRIAWSGRRRGRRRGVLVAVLRPAPRAPARALRPEAARRPRSRRRRAGRRRGEAARATRRSRRDGHRPTGRARAQPQRPDDEELRLPHAGEAGGRRPRPDHPAAGRGRRRVRRAAAHASRRRARAARQAPGRSRRSRRTATRWPAAATRCRRSATTGGSPRVRQRVRRRDGGRGRRRCRCTSRPPTSGSYLLYGDRRTSSPSTARSARRPVAPRRRARRRLDGARAAAASPSAARQRHASASPRRRADLGTRRPVPAAHDAAAAPPGPRSATTSPGRTFGGTAVPGGPRLRRRAHPRHGLRVPRRRRALRPAVAPVRRRRTRSSTAPTTTLTGGNGAVLEDFLVAAQPHARPGRLADVQGLAGARLADPRGHLLQVDGAVLARRPADLRQPAGREQQALQALPAQAQLLRRHGLDPAAGQRHAQAASDYIDAQYGGPGKGWYRIVTNPFQARKVINAGQARRGHGHRDQRAVRLHDEARRPDPRAPRRHIDQQLDEVRKMGVAQMELVNKFDNALAGVAGDTGADRRRWSTPPTSSRPARSGTCGTASRPTPRVHDQRPGSRRPDINRPRSRTRCSARSRRSRRCPTVALPLYPPRRPLQHPRPDRRSASTPSAGWPSGT